MAQSRFYEVTVKVLVVAPPEHSRTVEKIVHGLVQEYLPGMETGIGEASRIVGASAIEAKDVGLYQDPDPTCDLCGQPDGPGEPDWNGETGNHETCEDDFCEPCGASGNVHDPEKHGIPEPWPDEPPAEMAETDPYRYENGEWCPVAREWHVGGPKCGGCGGDLHVNPQKTVDKQR